MLVHAWKSSRIAANASGAAPWNEKIDCFSSPTAKIERRAGRARPAPAENSATNALDDVPLLWARVLRLVDQQMVDAEIELVVHPGRVDTLLEQSASVGSIRSS